MSGTVWLVIGWLGLVAGVGVLVALLALPPQSSMRQPGLPLAGTITLAIGVFSLVTGMLLADGLTGESDALRTGGLAAVSVVALYGLWLYDRRRRVDERRQQFDEDRRRLDDQRFELAGRQQMLEAQRAEQDRDRVADERFARAIELLGHETDQVRVGALHSLAGLARNRPDYTQTTLDILCSYLRRPFDHPSYAVQRSKLTAEGPAAPWAGEDRTDADLERQVRLTAQRLITELLPETISADTASYNLDLTGAALEYFDLSHRRVGTFTARSANFYEATSFEGTHFAGPMWLTWAHAWDYLLAHKMVCHKFAWFSNFLAEGEVDFDGTDFRWNTKFAHAAFARRVSFQGCVFAVPTDFLNASFRGGIIATGSQGLTGQTTGMLVSLKHDVQLPYGWVVDTHNRDHPTMGLVRA